MALNQTLELVKSHTCINCKKVFEGKYCPECGQRAGVSPNSPEFFLRSLLKALDLEQGMVITFLHMFFKPDVVIHQFLKGNTRKYANPIKYLLISITITFIFFFQEDNWLLYLRSALLLLIMWSANYVFSRPYTNFYGHLMIAFYQVGQISFMFLISAIIGRIFGKGDLLIVLKLLVFIAYPVWSSVKMFHLKSRQVLTFLLFILINFGAGLFLWLQFIAPYKS